MNDRFHRKTRDVIVLAALSGFLVPLTTGCQSYARITWDIPKAVHAQKKTVLAVGDLAELKRKGALWDRHPTESVIGRHTITIFAIPMGHINTHATTPLRQSFAQAVRDALQAAGYDLVDAAQAPKDSPVLRGEVTACWWFSYMWFWPFVIQGGQNQITLFLDAPDGTTLWKQKFSRAEPGLALVGSYGYDLMIKWSMTKLLRDIVRAVSSEEFNAALGAG
jgi:hypothetical protein